MIDIKVNKGHIHSEVEGKVAEILPDALCVLDVVAKILVKTTHAPDKVIALKSILGVYFETETESENASLVDMSILDAAIKNIRGKDND